MRQGVVLYTSNRLEDLLEALAAELASSPLPPLQTETIVVPGQGLARWLQLRLAERHGIAAGLCLPFPGAFLQRLSRAAASPGPDLFDKEVLHWRLWRLLGDATLARELGPAASYCRDDPDGRKRWQLGSRLGSCLDDYQLYRDDLLLRGARGDDLEEFGPHGPWQARLWRALLRDAGLLAMPVKGAGRKTKRTDSRTPLLFPELGPEQAPAISPVAGHRLPLLRELLADPLRARAVLPARISVFGAGTLAPAFLEMLRLCAAHVPVALFVPQPTPEYVGELRRAGEPGGNQLLARLGTEAREFHDQLVDLEERAGPVAFAHVQLAAPEDRAARPATLLGWLQHDIAAVIDRGVPAAGAEHEPIALEPDDDSVRVHDCHSPQRELEVVRDQILAAFARDGQLEPHEVLVLVPDIDTYAPYAHAVFGPVAKYLPFHVADKGPTAELPLCASLFALLQLAQDRLHVYDVLHLLEEPSMQRRFGLYATDLATLRHHCERAGIRWGLDGAWRERRFQVPPFEENAWLPGLDRLVLGTATGREADLVAGVLPVADTTDSRDALLARFVGFLNTLFRALEPLQRPHPAVAWADLLDGLLDVFYHPAGADDEQALADIRATTATLRGLAAAARTTEPIAPIVLQDWLREALQQAAGTRGFLAGAVTVAAMLPMRTVPVQHLFLCGLHDAAFPRRDQPATFDLMALSRRPGDRSLRLDDRQLFLDALLAARQRLHVTFVGHSQKDDSACAPSVVLAELLDVIDRGFTAPPGFASARAFVTVRHPLQAWSPRYRGGSDLRLFTYALRDAVLPQTLPTDEPAWCPVPLSPLDVPPARELALEALLEFWRHPCRHFLTRTIGLRVRRDDEQDSDTEPFALGPLERWRIEDEIVARTLRGDPAPRDPLARARATGVLPVGGQGALWYTAADDTAGEFLDEVLQHGVLGRVSLAVDVGGRFVHGDVEGLGTEEIVLARIAKLKPKDHLRAWILHVFAALARHQGRVGLPERTRVIGKDRTVALRALSADEAQQHMLTLLAGYDQGQRAPLPFFENTSYAYGETMAKKRDERAAAARARKKWAPDSGDFGAPPDGEDPPIELCMRGQDALALPAFAHWATAVWAVVHDYSLEEK